MVYIPVQAWTFMLVIGVTHGEWLPMLPTIGYWSALAITAVATLSISGVVGVSRALSDG